MSECEYKYQVGGSLKLHSPTYVEREADWQLYRALRDGECCYIFNSRQMGKSSLLSRTYSRLKSEGDLCVCLDLSAIGSNNITVEQWYKSIVSVLLLNLDLLGTSSLKDWWEQSADYSFLQKLRIFFERLLTQISERQLFIFIDEIDSVLSLNFATNDFFTFIRFCYNQRNINPQYQRLNFALFGVVSPSNLIAKYNRSPPFNLGIFIELNGFNLQEAFPLSLGLKSLPYPPQLLLAEILAWTGGQPFLTQKLCALVVKHKDDYRLAKYPPQELVSAIVEEYIIDNWQFQDRPEHLKTIENRLLNDRLSANRLLGIYQRVLQNENPVKLKPDPEQIELLLSGLVIRHNGYLKIRNIIYERVFNREWVAEKLASIRPYNNKINAWCASQELDNTQLLSKLELKNTLKWAESKQLGNLDYRFLNASQKAIQEITEKENFALLISQQANQLLAKARQYAKRKTKKMRVHPAWIFLCAIAIYLIIILCRSGGWLQKAEFTILDYYIQHFSTKTKDPPITIITIDESDLELINEFPLSDNTLTRALDIIEQQKPEAIGLDLFRYSNFNNDRLREFVARVPHLFTIEKIVGKNKIFAPSFISRSQVGFSDLVLDFDGKIRRALLSVRVQSTEIHLSFATKLALYYLAKRNIKPEIERENERIIKLGKTNFISLKSNSGAYINADWGGYQILLNNYRLLDRFTHFSLSELLAGRVSSTAIRGRIVLIGGISDTFGNLYFTPLNQRQKQQNIVARIAPVVVHANIISQILSSALEGNPILKVWSKSLEFFWILFWSIIGALLAWAINPFQHKISIKLGIVGLLIIITYFIFTLGWWTPVFPPILALIITDIFIIVIRHKQLDKAYNRHVIKYLIEYQDNNSTVAKVALSYLKSNKP